MYQIAKDLTIEMGHRLQNHTGKCRNLHGHSYKIEVTVESEKLHNVGHKEGMVEDYYSLKQALCLIDSIFDHALVLCIDDPMLSSLTGGYPGAQEYIKNVKKNHILFHIFSGVHSTRIVLLKKPPTAEVLGKVWLELIYFELLSLDPTFEEKYTLSKIVVKETATSSATIFYSPNPSEEFYLDHKSEVPS